MRDMEMPRLLRTKLGEDWTWTDDIAAYAWLVRHRGGLEFRLSDMPADEQVATAVATALLDAVEDGRKGLVAVQVSKHGDTISAEVVDVLADRVELTHVSLNADGSYGVAGFVRK